MASALGESVGTDRAERVTGVAQVLTCVQAPMLAP